MSTARTSATRQPKSRRLWFPAWSAPQHVAEPERPGRRNAAPANDDRTQRLPVIHDQPPQHPTLKTDPRPVLLNMLKVIAEGLQGNQSASRVDELMTPHFDELRLRSGRELEAALAAERRSRRAVEEAARMGDAIEASVALGELGAVHAGDSVAIGHAMAQRAVHAYDSDADTGMFPVVRDIPRAEIQPPLPPTESMQPPPALPVRTPQPTPAVAEDAPAGSMPAYLGARTGAPTSGEPLKASKLGRGCILLVGQAWVPVEDAVEVDGRVLVSFADRPDLNLAADSDVWVHYAIAPGGHFGDAQSLAGIDTSGVETDD